MKISKPSRAFTEPALPLPTTQVDKSKLQSKSGNKLGPVPNEKERKAEDTFTRIKDQNKYSDQPDFKSIADDVSHALGYDKLPLWTDLYSEKQLKKIQEDMSKA